MIIKNGHKKDRLAWSETAKFKLMDLTKCLIDYWQAY